MKKTIVLLLIILFLFTTFSITAQAGIKIWPGKVRVEMNKWFDNEEAIKQPIQITNPYTYGVNVTSRVENPSEKSITDSFSPIPETSWISSDYLNFLKYIDCNLRLYHLHQLCH